MPAKKSASPKPRKKSAGETAHPILQEIFARTRTAEFEACLRDLIVEICRFDTTPNPDVSVMREAEDGCFRIVERELGSLSFPGARLERRPINPAIQSHPNYSLLHFTKTPQRPRGLSPEETYAGRSNLLCLIPGTGGPGGQSVAVNSHIDVVAPFYPPHVEGDAVHGRGSADDKGPTICAVAALKLLSELMPRAGLAWKQNVTLMTVVEEETGGNGSLSLALDRELKKLYESMLVLEITSLKLHPANRGAVWYRAELQPVPGISLLEMAAALNEEMEKEGAAIRAESRHDLFPQRPVQTCHGIIGPFGEHPSRICGQAGFTIRFESAPGPKTEALVRDCLDSGLATYTGLYGDKSQVIDPATGKAMVPLHYELTRKGKSFEVTAWGATGHMGAIRERDGAITKMAHLVRSLVQSRGKIEACAGAPLQLQLTGHATGTPLVLEGGQGFVPTHGIDEVMSRMRAAAQRGAESCLRRLGRPERGEDVVRVTYEKLHNVAFDGDPGSPSMRHAIRAAQEVGIWKDEPILGWTVSCDARLFATEYPGMPVLTFGPGALALAHSDREWISLTEARAAVEFLAVFLLKQTGTI